MGYPLFYFPESSACDAKNMRQAVSVQCRDMTRKGGERLQACPGPHRPSGHLPLAALGYAGAVPQIRASELRKMIQRLNSRICGDWEGLAFSRTNIMSLSRRDTASGRCEGAFLRDRHLPWRAVPGRVSLTMIEMLTRFARVCMQNRDMSF